MLSNTAAPKYYSAFRDKVIAGTIPVCHEIEMEMNRIDGLIANPEIYYDDMAVEGFIKFCENELTLPDGSDLKLLDSFKLWAEELYGWYYFQEISVYEPYGNGDGRYVQKMVKKRLINKQIIVVSRSAAKTIYAECVQAYELVCNKRTTYGVVTAPTMRQSDETLGPIKTAITRSKGPLFKFLTNGTIHSTVGDGLNKAKLAATKKGIENTITNSIIEIRPMSIDKLQGLRQNVATVDEWLSGDIREDVLTCLDQSGSKQDGYIIIAISSEGTVRNGPGDSIKMEMMSILKGDFFQPHVSIFWYKLDNIKEVSDPAMWLKANPNLGFTVSYETYQLDLDKAEKIPSSRNEILAKRFGLPMEGYTYFFTYEETLPHQRREYWRMQCALGADLSQGDDFCAFDFLFPLNDGSFGVKTRCYITAQTLAKLPVALRQKYEEFISEGSLIIMDGVVLDMMSVYDDLDEHIVRCEYDVTAFGYDPYNAAEFVKRWESENGPYNIYKVRQGARTESVPLGNIKHLAEERMLLFDEKIMEFAMGNAITMEDSNGNRKLLKKRREQKIDPVAALINAFVALQQSSESFG